ncbi:UDP-N-acetylglucosamine 2-epimerase [Modestobacter sp. VKM Ac-2983]|uniref:UDP-N-acetylglucosamine 2-epimerase n=1 Tax=Modestobacter sp. VKM Ac-2983 TaxID=3004137 RepID=UPI0022AB9A0F|nr:UDP-N-acetylglucosamine 2-epimerase [Modestobacter sp. VKM Ac-2983]MCZ2806488.1 UDP-N-acetylglucosamine 2-epimerase [Modestobacter sp. VKM Ac-2983]
MIAFIVGTTAELIKMAPVFHELTGRGRNCEIWYTAQHVEELSGTLIDLDLPAPAEWLVPEDGAGNLAKVKDVPGWGLRLLRTVASRRRHLAQRLASDGQPPLVLVHGDTFTAPLGALIGHRLGARVGHVEAGMRSGSLRHPFPEELNRRVAGRIVDVHFAPTETEAHNLRGRRGAVVTTGANTVVDAVKYALARPEGPSVELPAEFAVATLHRFELVRQENQYREVLEILREHSERLPIVYFAGASERARLSSCGLLDLFDGERFRIEDKLNYVHFLPVLARARFVVTDSGGLQQETGHLGIPCAVHRAHTEVMAGEGERFVLTRLDAGRLRGFLDDPERYRSAGTLGTYHPSRVIADAIETLT